MKEPVPLSTVGRQKGLSVEKGRKAAFAAAIVN